ncbi:MAG TPA: hypothetical protein VMM58_13125 [Bacteroidota bacterium]|nr:hypothetical protein [Bacteroidota bacterium]
MKTIACVCFFALSSVGLSQVSYPMPDDQTRSEMSASERESHDVNRRDAFGITTGVAGFKIDNVTAQGFDIDLHALFSKTSPVRFEFNAGVVLYNTPSSEWNYSSSYSPFMYQSNVYSQSQFSQPRFNLNFALGYLGTDAVFYFSEGKVRPYVAAGIEAVTWQMNQGFGGTLAPSARAGLEIGINRSFSGFAEARYMYGFPNVLNQNATQLNYVTSVAFGVSFAPQM